MTVLTIWQEAGVTAIACYNDDAPIASIFAPQLSTVRINTAGLGRYLAALALGVAEEPSTSSPASRDGQLDRAGHHRTAP